MKRSATTMALIVAAVLGLPLVTWALMLGGPSPDPAGLAHAVSNPEGANSWVTMAMGMGFLAVSGWHRWQEKKSEA